VWLLLLNGNADGSKDVYKLAELEEQHIKGFHQNVSKVTYFL